MNDYILVNNDWTGIREGQSGEIWLQHMFTILKLIFYSELF